MGKTPGKTTGKTTGKTRVALLNALANDGRLSIPQLAQALGKSERAVERAIKGLREQGVLERLGPAKGGEWKVKN